MPLATSMMIGAAIGAVVGVPAAIIVVARRRRVVVDEAARSGFEATDVRPDWLHIGMRARFRVTLTRQGERYERVALVDVAKRVTWDPPLEP